ncbi:hypothetical protein KALB_4939 [Kutzneria albida DSM 43870]|uniref:Uncharacterized protein n=1 Tax=Kutzneria albida DSM 43870 TaxID=1449976 RepID=W5WCM6_9PSEU|nr:hypothetical protein KALB_4939 [Kutzneria albida DSM 43870]
MTGPELACCNFCHRPGIVVDRHTGYLAPHRTERHSRTGKPKGATCPGSGRHRDTRPEETT